MKKLLLMVAMLGAALMAEATKYQKVTDASTLADGDVIVLANEAAGKVSSAIASTGKYIDVANATIANGELEATGLKEITLTQSGSNWTMKIGTTVLGASGTDFSTNSSSVKTYTIAISNGDATIASTATASGKIQYNSASPRFKLYTSTQGSVQIYKKVPGSNPVLTLSKTAIAFETRSLSEGTASDEQTLTVTASDLAEQNITLAMKHGTVFSVAPATLTNAGGSATISYTATAEGEYRDTLVVTGTTMAATAIVAECPVSVTIDPAAPTGVDQTYNILQNVSDLHEGDKVFFGTAAKDYVMGLYNNAVASSNIRCAAATYTTDRHQVTANDLYAYTVSIVDGNYVFTGSDGKYLYMYNTNKNLSSSETLNNQAKWTLTIADDVATIKSVYSSSWTIYFNKTASTPLFCTYNYKDANLADVVLYSDNAPAYQEKVLHPALTVSHDGVAVGDTLDWGEVVYDDSYGLAEPHYTEAKTLTVSGIDLTSPISVTLQSGTAFETYTASLGAQGGSLTVNFAVDQPGTYTDVLTISSDTLVKTIVLRAKAVREATVDPTTEPTLTLSETALSFSIDLANEYMDIQELTFSAANLSKTLYVKWLKNNTEPTEQQGLIEVLVGEQEIGAGETAPLPAPTVDETSIYVSVTAYQAFTYSTKLQFYSYKEGSKTELAIDEEVTISVVVTEAPTGLENVSLSGDGKQIREGRVVIIRDGVVYSASGKVVGGEE